MKLCMVGSVSYITYIILFACNNSYQTIIQMPIYEALYGRKRFTHLLEWCGGKKDIWSWTSEQMVENVQLNKEQLRIAQNKQKIYANYRRRALDFQVGDYVFLEVSLNRGVRRFGIWGCDLFEVFDRIREATYKITSQLALAGVHKCTSCIHIKKMSHLPGSDSWARTIATTAGFVIQRTKYWHHGQ